MTNAIPSLDPSTIISGLIVGVGSAALLAVLAWILGPLKWPFQSKGIRKILLNARHCRFVYNPGDNKSKFVKFLPGGQIGEGKNSNENTWRLRHGKLEILAFDGQLYSRFRYNRKTGKLEHTNDPDARSTMGQYFEPQFKSWEEERRPTR
jgi:hypothetical protein